MLRSDSDKCCLAALVLVDLKVGGAPTPPELLMLSLLDTEKRLFYQVRAQQEILKLVASSSEQDQPDIDLLLKAVRLFEPAND